MTQPPAPDVLAHGQPEQPQTAEPDGTPVARPSIWSFRIARPAAERELFQQQLGIYLAAMYPGCPPRTRDEILKHAGRKRLYGRLGEIAGILVTNHIRHRATDYERLMQGDVGAKALPREKARDAVRARVNTVTALWRQGAANDQGLARLRKKYRALRRGEHPSGDLTARENADLAEHLVRWLERVNSRGAADTR